MMSTQRFVARAVIAGVLAGNIAFGQAQRAGDPEAVAPPALNGPLVKVGQGEVQGTTADGVAVFRGLPFTSTALGVPVPPTATPADTAAAPYAAGARGSSR
jgi:hypothetical protein